MTESSGPFWLGVSILIPGVAVIPFLSLFLLSTADSNIGNLYALFIGLLAGVLPIGFGIALILRRGTYAVYTLLLFGTAYSGLGVYRYNIGKTTLTTPFVGLVIAVLGLGLLSYVNDT